MNYYDSIASGYDELHGHEQKRKLALISSAVKTSKSDRLLDVGAGPGYTVDFFDCAVVAIDPSIELLKKNRSALRVVGRAEELPFKDHSFDVVLCLSAIHHCDVQKAVDEMCRVGKSLFIISVLKKSKQRESIEILLRETFKIEKVLDGDKDVIVVGKKR